MFAVDPEKAALWKGRRDELFEEIVALSNKDTRGWRCPRDGGDAVIPVVPIESPAPIRSRAEGASPMTDDRFTSPGWFLRPDRWHEWMPSVPWMNGLASPEPRQLPAPFPLKWEQGPNGGLTARPNPLPNPDGSYWWVSINPMQRARGNSDAASSTSFEPGWAPARMPPRSANPGRKICRIV